MQRAVGNPPARLGWGLFGLVALLSANGVLAAVPITRPELAQVGKPDAREAARLIERVRNSGLPGEYYLEFELRSLARRGRGPTFHGRWWGSRNEQGVVLRIEVLDAAGMPHRLLLQNGE